LGSRIGFSDELWQEWDRTKASRHMLKKKLKKQIKNIKKARLRASDWIVANINPDVYSLDFGDIDFGFDSIYGKSNKKKKKKR